jgi:Cu(I)/Ag(I) efflux system membrane fusion protein
MPICNRGKAPAFLIVLLYMLLVVSTSLVHSAEKIDASEIAKSLSEMDALIESMQSIANDNQDEIYACPMHPDVIAHAPGSCPICGMSLVPYGNSNTAQGDLTVESNGKAGQLRKNVPPVQKTESALLRGNDDSKAANIANHGHPLTQRMLPEIAPPMADLHPLQSAVAQDTHHLGEQPGTTFICPMHPQIMQHEPGGNCPICGMNLVEKESAAPADDHHQVFLEAAVIQNMGVRIAKVNRKILRKQIHTQGRVTPDDDRILSIHPRTAGWIEVLHPNTEGDRVERKEELVDFYSPWINQVQLDYIAALEAYDQTSFDPSRKTELGAKVDALQNSLRLLNVMDMDIARIKNSRKVQNTIQLTAPQGGIITSLNVSEGTYVEPYQSMFTIVDLSKVWVMVDIYEHQAPWVRKGDKAMISAPAIPARIWQGVIDFIYPEVDAKTRTLRARINVDNPDEALLLNMFVKVDITANTTKQAVLTVPREAVILTGEREVVIKSLGKGHFQPVDVKTGNRGEGSVEILSGLALGDEIVVSGQFLIDSEASLQASFLRMSE